VPSQRRVAGAEQVLAPLGCAATIRRAGTDRVVELTVGGTCAIGPVGIEAVPAEHDGRRYPLGPRIPSLGFLLDGPTRIYFAGDTDLFDGMARLAGRVDVALLPVAGWGPRLPPGHLDPESAARAVALIRPSVAVPIHWGTMRSVGARPDSDPRRPALAFAAAVEKHAPETAVSILMPGETMSLAAAR
jgi:L-ascorbate metabolism protein UlaG (beta-lactamase superfamily)